MKLGVLILFVWLTNVILNFKKEPITPKLQDDYTSALTNDFQAEAHAELRFQFDPTRTFVSNGNNHPLAGADPPMVGTPRPYAVDGQNGGRASYIKPGE
jgi:hypothetical protein